MTGGSGAATGPACLGIPERHEQRAGEAEDQWTVAHRKPLRSGLCGAGSPGPPLSELNTSLSLQVSPAKKMGKPLQFFPTGPLAYRPAAQPHSGDAATLVPD